MGAFLPIKQLCENHLNLEKVLIIKNEILKYAKIREVC